MILFLDTFAEARTGDALDARPRRARAAPRSRRATSSGATASALVTFGGILRWLVPGMGIAQRYRIVDALLETEIVFNYAWKDVSIDPRRGRCRRRRSCSRSRRCSTTRSVAALLDLRARGYDLAVVEVSPVPFAEPGESELDQLAYRLWLLHRAGAARPLRARSASPSRRWGDERPLEAALEGVRAFRRHARLARV